MASELSARQPTSESNRALKLCAQCETECAALFCSKCRCTPYCSKPCQAQHWRNGHKKHCRTDPLVAAMTTNSPPPTYEPYSALQQQKGLYFAFLPGKCSQKPVDERDAMCQLIQNVDEEFHLDLAHRNPEDGEVDHKEATEL